MPPNPEQRDVHEMNAAPTTFLSFEELRSVKTIPFSKTHLYRLIALRRFPRPVKLGATRVAFIEAEIDAWIAARVAERDAAA